MSAFCLAYGANAQENAGKSVVFKDYQGAKMRPAPGYKKGMANIDKSNSANKTTVGGDRWMFSYDIANGYFGSDVLGANDFVFHVAWDSLLKQKYNTGYAGVNWIAMAQYVDPFADGFKDPIVSGANEIVINKWDAYTLDSILFNAAYVQSPVGGAGTKDTLYLSVAPVAPNLRKYTKADYATAEDYAGVKTHGGELPVQRLGATDSFNRQLGNAGAIKWKYVIPDTMRKPMTAQGQYQTRSFRIALPSTLSIPAGSGFAISVAFKSGETWAAGDSIPMHHYFMPLASQYADNARMPYFYYDYNDLGMSYLMHKDGQGSFGSSIALEMANTIDFAQEFLPIGGHVKCSTCFTVGVNNVSNVITGVTAVPNPATEQINVKFALQGAANTTVNVTNAVGQVVASQNMGNVANGTATFSVANLNNGVYFYTVEANGQRMTKRFVVAH